MKRQTFVVAKEERKGEFFGTDEVASASQEKYLKVYYQYEPFWKLLTQEASAKVRKDNYQRIFDEARRRVRTWEQAHAK